MHGTTSWLIILKIQQKYFILVAYRMHNNLIRPWQFDKTYGTFYILLLLLLINLNWTRFYSIL